MPDLSIIIPYVNEWPQIAFSIRSIADPLIHRGIDFEIIAVDNFSVAEMGKRPPDRSHKYIKGVAKMHPWLRYLKYDKKLSNWNSKNLAIKKSTSPILAFIDAHCVPQRDCICDMFEYYRDNWEELNGSIHLPLTYQILEDRPLRYRLKLKKFPHQLHYVFTDHKRNGNIVEEVPCMSSCGLMIHRSFLDLIGNWPSELGIYGGGENFINFAGAVCGLKKWIFSEGLLHHHGENRGYNWSDKDWIRNRTIAVYMYGGYEMAKKFCLSLHVPNMPRYSDQVLYTIFCSVADTCGDHRKLIKSRQVMPIEEWAAKW